MHPVTLLSAAIEVSGWAGALVLLVAYAALSAGRLVHRSATYQWMNVAGALGLMVNAAFHGSWPPVAVNLVWMTIAATALARRPVR